VVVGQDCDLHVIERGGVTRGYLQRTDIASTTYLMNTVERIGYYGHAGQSLSIGGGADINTVLTIPSPLAPGNCLMFKGGARGVMGASSIPADDISDFVAIFEEFDADPPERGETQGSAALFWTYRMADLEKQALPVNVYRSHGQGNQEIADLIPGSIPYTNGLTEITAAVAVAAEYGKLLRCNSIFWSQGEADRSGGTTQEDYYDALVQIAADYRTDWGAILPGDNGTIHFIVDQLSSGQTAAAGVIALAQLEAARDEAEIHISTPKYIAEFYDGLHLTSAGYDLVGEYNMRCARVVEQTGTWVELDVATKDLTGRVITLTFSVPEGDLAWNTRDLPEAENYGFLYADDGTALIESVEITGPDTVTITLDDDPDTNPTISYAYEGGAANDRAKDWGNLVSPSTDPSFQRAGRYLDHWCVIFKETL
jgi:hypothetical protein